MSENCTTKLKFSKWYAWDRRNECEFINHPGVYLICISKKRSMHGQKAELKDVVYIGMTLSKKGLKGRWNQFHSEITKSPIPKKSIHAGGRSIRKDTGEYSTWRERLYVAAIGIDCNVCNPVYKDYLSMGIIRCLEYKAFAKYYADAGGHPPYNKQ